MSDTTNSSNAADAGSADNTAAPASGESEVQTSAKFRFSTIFKACGRLRWKLGLAIFAVGAIAQAICWNVWAEDRTSQVFSAWYIWPANVFCLLLWWSFLSGLRWRTRGWGVLAIGTSAAMFFTLFVVSFDGAMWPTIAWRWGDSTPDWAEGQTGERSAESLALEQKRKQEATRFAALQKSATDNQSIAQRDPRQFTPAEFARATGDAHWQRLESVDGLAIAFGSGPRALFKTDQRPAGLDDWPRFRGPQQDGVVRNASLQTDIANDNPPETLWATEQRVGHGWSSFAVFEGLAFTLEQRSEQETTVCYDFASGSQIWTKHDDVHFHGNLGGDGPRSTPTVFGRRLYTLGATGILNCRDLLDGKLYWTRNILSDADANNLVWGISTSPLVAGNLVFVNGGEGKEKGTNKAVTAYNRFDGTIVWTAGDEPASYCTPSIARIHGVDQLLIFNGWGLIAYNPTTGVQLWKYAWTNQPKVNAAQPIVVGNQVFISSGYGSGCALLTISIADGKWSVDAKVNANQFRLKFNDGVYKDGYVYGLDESFLSCIDFKTLKVQWKIRGKFGYGQTLLVGDTLVVTTEAGEVVLIPATPQRPREIARFRGLNRHVGALDKRGVGWNHSVFVDGKLLMRNDREVACYKLGESRTPPGDSIAK